MAHPKATGVHGLEVVRDVENATLDIIAVHGLGAASANAWRFVEEIDGRKTGNIINWLDDERMLPSAIPNARILAFNYESRWHTDATQISMWGLGDELMREVWTKREHDKNPEVKQRPIIFIGHSFGGIVIEQGIVNASFSKHVHRSIPRCTVGVALLGTPHQGSASADWGSLIAKMSKTLGFAGDSKLLEDLQRGSPNLARNTHQFMMWLNNHSADVCQFYETYMTNYTKSFGLNWQDLVVAESSACLVGRPGIPLPTDHLKLARYRGPDDPAYIKVKDELVLMARNAAEQIKLRFNPRTFIQDNSQIPAVHLECQKALFISWPDAELKGIQRRLGKRTPETCEWLLDKPEYNDWLVGKQPQVLRLVGHPGMGKSMIMTFLIEQFTLKLQSTPDMTLAYHFCDNRNQSSNNACAVVRQMLFQLFQQRPNLFPYLQKAYDVAGNKLFHDFDTMWKILVQVLENFGPGDIFILLDALDECDEDSRRLLMEELKDITSKKINVRIFFTCRPETDIERQYGPEEMKTVSCVVGKEDINNDLVKYMAEKVPDICKKNQWGPKEQKLISDTLVEKADGIFLWCAFVLHDIAKVTNKASIPEALRKLPRDLVEVYQRITKNFPEFDEESARMVLEVVSGARRPLTVDELTMTYILADDSPHKWQPNTLPDEEECSTHDQVYRCCGRLLRYDEPTNTINLVHQSAKDYLLSEYLAGENRGITEGGQRQLDDKQRRANTKDTSIRLNNLFLAIIFRYFLLSTFNHLRDRMVFDAEWDIDWECSWWEMENSPPLMVYAGREWELHAKDAEGHAKQEKFDGMDQWNKYIRNSTKNSWLRKAATDGNVKFVGWLLSHGAERDSADFRGWTSLQLAAKHGKEDVIRFLVEKKADPNAEPPHIDGRTPIQTAAEENRKDIVELLLGLGAEINNPPAKINGRTALQAAAEKANIETLMFLLDRHDIDPNVEGARVAGVTALLAGAGSGGEWQMGKNIHRTIKQRSRLPGSAEIDTAKIAEEDQQDRDQRQKEESSHEKVVRLLVDSGRNVKLIPNQFGWTALHAAVERESDDMVDAILSIENVNPNHKGNHDGTPLHSAKAKANEELARILEGRKGTDECAYSKLDLDAMMKYIRAVLTRLMIKSNTERFFFIQSYIPIYHVVYSYCAEGADDQNDNPPVEEGGRRGELVYRDVDAWLKSYVMWNQKFIYDTYNDPKAPAQNDFLTVYLREWKLFKRGGYYVGRMLRYLTRHWVKHQREELKHKDVRDIADLFFHRWRAGMTSLVRERIRGEMVGIDKHISTMSDERKDTRVLDAINESLGCSFDKFPKMFQSAKEYFVGFGNLAWDQDEDFELTLRGLTDEFEVESEVWTKGVPDDLKEKIKREKKHTQLVNMEGDTFHSHVWKPETADFYLNTVEPYFLAPYSGGKTKQIKEHLDKLWDMMRERPEEAEKRQERRAQNLNAAATNAELQSQGLVDGDDTHMTNGIVPPAVQEANHVSA